MPARKPKRNQEGCSSPKTALGVIQIPNPSARRRPMAEPRQKTVALRRPWFLCAAMTSARTNTSGLRRTTMPMEKAVVSVWGRVARSMSGQYAGS